MKLINLVTLPADSPRNFTTGIDQMFVYVAGEVSVFVPLLLLTLFLIVFLGGLFAQQRREGSRDSAQWFAIAGFVTSTIALFMLLIEGLTNVFTVSVVVVVAIAGMTWFLFTKDK